MNIIVGYENEKREIAELRDMLLRSDDYRKRGVRVPRGLVLYGEPGVGKTQLAKSIADKRITCVEFMPADSDRNGADCGELQNSLHDAFDIAKQNMPAVVLLDELDKIAGTSENYFMENNTRLQNLLMRELDGLAEDSAVLVVATCNDTDVLGDVLLRPGRFDRRVHVEAPDAETREKILKVYFDKIQIERDLDLGYVARITPGYTGAGIECLANEVGIYAMVNGCEKITINEVRRVMNKLAFDGMEKVQFSDDEQLRRIAIHEAGHAVVAMALCPGKLFGASVLPQGNSNGHTVFINRGDGVSSVRELEDEVAMLLGGHVAERVTLGEYMLGSSDDLNRAEGMLRFLAGAQGAYGYECTVGTTGPRFAVDAKSELNKVIVRKLYAFDSLAEQIITRNKNVFETIVAQLMEKQTLSAEELKEIREKMDFDSEEKAPLKKAIKLESAVSEYKAAC